MRKLLAISIGIKYLTASLQTELNNLTKRKTDVEPDSFIGQELPLAPSATAPSHFSNETKPFTLFSSHQSAPNDLFSQVGNTHISNILAQPSISPNTSRPHSHGSAVLEPDTSTPPISLQTTGCTTHFPSVFTDSPPLVSYTPYQQTPPVSKIIPHGSSNTYRLGSQKKLYAQIPGLSNSSPVAPLSLNPSQSNTFVASPPLLFSPPVAMSTDVSNNQQLPQSQVASSTISGISQYQSPTASELETPTVLPPSFNNLAQAGPTYRPVYHHWFYKKEIETKTLWQPFSMSDSLALEKAVLSADLTPETLVATDGGRYDVNIVHRQRISVYWEENPTEVRRCSWFSKGSIDSQYVPYDENISSKLEEEFRTASQTNIWHNHVELPDGETVVFHGQNVISHHPQAGSPDAWGNTPQTLTRPRVVKRGVDEFEIDDGEPNKIDHVLFLVHGIGSVCDLRFRAVEEVVDDFRSLSLQLVQSHFRTSSEQGLVNRIEVLPVSWHSALHSEDTGIDRKLRSITLPSIPKLRNFTNDTLLDILFYTSPVFCQTIINAVGKELNRLYDLFQERNPDFKGGVSVGGHSLGTLILFDLLYHQKPPTNLYPEDINQPSRESSAEPNSEEDGQDTVAPLTSSLKNTELKRKLSRRISYVMGNAGTGQPFISYPQLTFCPKAFFALGSPIGMFVTVRGIDTLGEDFHLPTCPSFFNIFHPFDPVAYRIETLINPDFKSLKPVMIPHHKGRKRMHLELKETMTRVGADLKQKFLDSVRSTWNTVYQLAMFHRSEQALEQEMNKVLEEEIQKQETDNSQISDAESETNIIVGQLNGGRRIDYVLQEAPFESINEYLFALGSHVCYWESEDTMLMILKEIYGSMGIQPDGHSYHPGISIEREMPLKESENDAKFSYNANSADLSGIHLTSTETYPLDLNNTPAFTNLSTVPGNLQSNILMNQTQVLGMDPTVPKSNNKNLGPPPLTGFVRK